MGYVLRDFWYIILVMNPFFFIYKRVALTLSRPWVKKSWKIKRIAISKLVLGILIMCKRISVYLCVDLSVCKVLVFRKLLLHLWSYGNKLYIKRFLKPLGVSWNLLWLKKSLRARHIAQLLDPPISKLFYLSR